MKVLLVSAIFLSYFFSPVSNLLIQAHIEEHHSNNATHEDHHYHDFFSHKHYGEHEEKNDGHEHKLTQAENAIMAIFNDHSPNKDTQGSSIVTHDNTYLKDLRSNVVVLRHYTYHYRPPPEFFRNLPLLI